jgi:hypothetical protein
MSADHPASVHGAEAGVADPGKWLRIDGFLSEQPEESGKAPPSYSCPMHPEVVAHERATCPKCGMNLEPIE